MHRTIPRLLSFALLISAVGPFLGSPACGQEVKTMWVAHRRVDCIGVAPQKCYLIKNTQYEDWRFWYDEIEGFEFEEGYAYELLVREVKVENPPADAPAKKLELVEILLKVETYERKNDPAPPPPPVAPAPAEPETVEVEPTPMPPPPAMAEPATTEVEPTPVPPAPSQPVQPPATKEVVAPAPAPVPVPAPVTQPAAPEPAPAPAPTPSAPTPPTPAAPSQPRAPQGQEVRGHLSIGAGVEARSFKICGAKESVWVEDRTGNDLWNTYREMTKFPNRPLFMVVRGELKPPPPSGFGAHYPEQLLIYDLRHTATESAGCFDDVSRLQFRASGNEPSWSLEISQRGLALSEMGQEGRTLFPYAPPSLANGQIVYRSQTGGNNPRSIQVTLMEQPCSDTMADSLYSYAASLVIDGRTVSGCALAGGLRP